MSEPVTGQGCEPVPADALRGTPFYRLVPAELAQVGTELTVEWADFWGRGLGDAAVEVCQYPFIELVGEAA